tara:strand:+ start:1242 stop:1610 length:369 start_codon:yes stop_codon:yes gene_type:complete
MAKRIVAKTGEYQKDGQTKGEYTKLGVMLSNDNGEYMLLDPSVSLAGVLIKQNSLAAKSGGQQRDMLMISIFEDDNQQQNNSQQSGFKQAPQQNNNQQQNNHHQQYNQNPGVNNGQNNGQTF